MFILIIHYSKLLIIQLKNPFFNNKYLLIIESVQKYIFDIWKLLLSVDYSLIDNHLEKILPLLIKVKNNKIIIIIIIK